MQKLTKRNTVRFDTVEAYRPMCSPCNGSSNCTPKLNNSATYNAVAYYNDGGN